MKILKHIIAFVIPAVALLGCSASKGNADSSDSTQPDSIQQNMIEFNQDSALAFVKAQCDFGPRVPNTDAHRRCGEYLVAKLRATGANVIEQNAKLKAFDGTVLNAKDGMSRFHSGTCRLIYAGISQGTILGRIRLRYNLHQQISSTVNSTIHEAG